MADKNVTALNYSDCEGQAETAIGKTALLYDTYANAIAFGATGLLAAARLFEMDVKDESKGTAITQDVGGVAVEDGRGTVTPAVGVNVDVNGNLNCVIDDNAGAVTEFYYVSDTGRGRQPRLFTLV